MKKTIVLILIIFVVISVCSCEAIQKQIKEESVEKIVGKIMGEEVDVTIVSATPDPDSTSQPTTSDGLLDNIIKSDEDGSIAWPENIPNVVPKVNSSIKSRVKTPNGVILDFGEMGSQAALSYIDLLLDNSYESVKEDSDDKKIDSLYKKGDSQVTVHWYEGGSFSVMITW